MSLQQRPNISIKENLISTIQNPNPTSFTVGFLAAEKGQANIDTMVLDQVDFINKFGYPTEYNFKSWYNIYEYLRYVQNIHVMRVIDTSWTNSSIQFGYDDRSQLRYSSMVSDIYNEDIAFNNILNFSFLNNIYKYAVFNREVTQNEDVAVSICTNITDFDESISTESVNVFTDLLTELPSELLSTMEKDQLYILNDSGTYSVQKLSYLYAEDLNTVGTTNDNGTPKTRITIDYNANLYETGTFIYTDLYFRNTKNNTINNQKYTIDSESNNGVTTTLTLTENLNLWDTTGKVVFYDVRVEWSSDIITTGYLLDEQKYVTVTDGAGGYITYSDTDYDYTVTNEYTAIRTVYDNKIQNGSTIKTFRQILNKDVDFTKNFVVLVFKKISGLFSLMEVFEVADSRDTTIDAMYKRNFCEDVINQYSKLIYFRKNSTSNATMDTLSTNLTTILNTVLTDSTATDYTDLDDYTTFETATNFYRYSNSISLKYIMGIELDNGTFNTMNLASSIADERKDCIAINSIWDETDYLADYTGMVDTLLDQYGIKNNPKYLNINSTYNIVYDNMKMIYDEFNEKFRWIPIIGDITGIYTIEDNNGNVYNACAGFQTTPIQNYLKLLITNNTDDELDSLSYHSINHIQKSDTNNNYYLYDILMYIDEDLLTKRLNIRRTLNHFKYLLRNTLKPYFFEYNSDTLRKKVTSTVKRLIDDMLKNGAIIYGNVVCDSSNNSADAINNNELYINIYLQPTQVIRQINIEINIEKGTVSLTESEV